MQKKLILVAVASALSTFARLPLAALSRRAGFMLGAVELELDKAAWTKLSKDVQALYTEKDGKYVLGLPEGVEPVGGLKTALEKEREARKEAEKQFKALATQWEGLDPKQIKDMLEKLGGDQEAQLIKAGKIDEVVALRTAKATEAHAKELKKREELVAAANARADKFAGQVLDNHVRAAAAKAGLHANAVEDALFRARTIFKLDDEGSAVQLGADGKPVLGKDNKTSFSPAEWLEGMRESAPHWFPASNSGASAPGGKGSGSGKIMKRAAFDQLGVQEKATAAQEVREGKLTLAD